MSEKLIIASPEATIKRLCDEIEQLQALLASAVLREMGAQDEIERLRRASETDGETIDEHLTEIERLREQNEIDDGADANLRHEIERLRAENWQLKQACGYPIPADKETINNPFKCGTCDAKSIAMTEMQAKIDTLMALNTRMAGEINRLGGVTDPI